MVVSVPAATKNRLKSGYLCGQEGLQSSGTQEDGGGLPQVGTLGIIMKFGTACQPCGPVQFKTGIDTQSLVIAP